LSHLLFVIAMEALSKMLYVVENGGLLSSFSMGSRNIGALSISHLLFANDTLIFCGANPNHLYYLCALFLCFEAVSSLKINMAKPKLVLVGNVTNVARLADILGCEISSLPLKYLGLLSATYFKAKSIWYGVIEKIEHCLAS